jgi:steroid delta-isomerase-like uncharacterized protein
MERRDVLAMVILAGATVAASGRRAQGAEACPPADAAGGASAALLDRYVAAVNAHDTSSFPELFTDTYIQHSGRSPSGLAAQIENFRRIMTTMPDVRMRIEDRIIAGDRVVARTTYSATHTQPIRGVAPTGKAFRFRTIDIWRVENGKFAEHWDLTDVGDVVRQLGGQ